MTDPQVSPEQMAALRSWSGAPGAVDRFVAELAELVAIPSGVGDAVGVARVAEALAAPFRDLGAAVELRSDGPAGPTLVAQLTGARPGRRLALIGHLDTVGAPDDPAPRLDVRDGRAWGMGSVDMKGGLLLAVHALQAIRVVAGGLPFGEVLVIDGPDEEIGSPVGSVAMRELVPGCDAALVLEPGRPSGALVVARKGMLQARVRVTGRAAHAGVEPDKGRSALLAAAHATIALHALSGTVGGAAGGVTVNVGTMHGGTRPNVVPAEATLELDLRATTVTAMDSAIAAIRAVCAAPAVPDVTMDLTIATSFPPMERLPSTDAMLARVAGVASMLGLSPGAVATGGASDANTIAGLGVPVLDGLGPIGGGMHGPDEHIELAALPDRVALLAGAILELTAPG